jgi:hypothetical protein
MRRDALILAGALLAAGDARAFIHPGGHEMYDGTLWQLWQDANDGTVLQGDPSPAVAMRGVGFETFTAVRRSGDLQYLINRCDANSHTCTGFLPHPVARAFNSAPVLATPAGAFNEVDLFGIGQDGLLYMSTFDGIGWSAWCDIGHGATWSPSIRPAVVSRSSDTYELLVSDGIQVFGLNWFGNGCGGWGLPSVIAFPSFLVQPSSFALAGVATDANRSDFFVVGNDHGLYTGTYSLFAGWGAPLTPLAGSSPEVPFASAPAAIARNGYIDVVIVDGGILFEGIWNGANWNPFVPIPNHIGNIVGDPAFVSMGPYLADVFANGSGGGIVHASFSGFHWTFEFVPTPVTITGGVAAVTGNGQRFDVYANKSQ